MYIYIYTYIYIYIYTNIYTHIGLLGHELFFLGSQIQALLFAGIMTEPFADLAFEQSVADCNVPAHPVTMVTNTRTKHTQLSSRKYKHTAH